MHVNVNLLHFVIIIKNNLQIYCGLIAGKINIKKVQRS